VFHGKDIPQDVPQVSVQTATTSRGQARIELLSTPTSDPDPMCHGKDIPQDVPQVSVQTATTSRGQARIELLSTPSSDPDPLCHGKDIPQDVSQVSVQTATTPPTLQSQDSPLSVGNQELSDWKTLLIQHFGVLSLKVAGDTL
jgi:hypothetical protein